MAKLDSIFVSHESRLAPGVEDPQAAVRDRILYRSAEREAGTRPRRSPGGSMDTALPGEFEVTSSELSIGALGVTGEHGTTPAARSRDHLGDVGDVGGVGDIGGVDDIGERGGVGDIGGVDDIGERGGVGDIGRVDDLRQRGELGEVGEVGGIDDLEEARRPGQVRASDADGERGLRMADEDADRDERAGRRERKDLGELDLADLDSDSLATALSTSDEEEDDDDLMGSALRLASLSV